MSHNEQSNDEIMTRSGRRRALASSQKIEDPHVKKNSFLGAAGIATLGLVITRIVSVVYLIPFSAMTFGQPSMNAVYNNANTIFVPFYELSLAGLPSAIAYLVSLYNSKNEYKTSNRVLKYSLITMLVLGGTITLIFVIMTPFYAKFQILNPGSAEALKYAKLPYVPSMNFVAVYESLKTAMYVIAPALLLTPILSGMRGYLQGFKTWTGVSISQVVEQLFRTVLLLILLYVCLTYLELPREQSMAISMIAIPLAAAAAISVLLPFFRSVRKEHVFKMEHESKESTESTKELFKIIFKTALPFVLAGIATTLYTQITMFTFKNTYMWAQGVPLATAETQLMIINEWSSKLVSIPLTFSLALSGTIVSFITASYESKKYGEVKKYTVRSYRMTTFFTLGIVLGMVGLIVPLVTFFNGATNAMTVYKIARFDAFRGVLFAFLGITISILQAVGQKNRAVVYGLIGPAVKLILNVPFIYLFGTFGDILATMFGIGTVVVIATIQIVKVTKIKPGMIIKTVLKTFIAGIPMLLAIDGVNYLVTLLMPAFIQTRFGALVHMVLGFIVGAPIFLVIADRIGLISETFGKEVTLRNFIQKAILKR